MFYIKVLLLLATLLLLQHVSCSSLTTDKLEIGDNSDASFYLNEYTWEVWMEEDSWPYYGTYRINSTIVAINDFKIQAYRDTLYILHRFPAKDETEIPLTEIALKKGESAVLSMTYRLSRFQAILNMKMRYVMDNYGKWIYGQTLFVYFGKCPTFLNKCIVH